MKFLKHILFLIVITAVIALPQGPALGSDLDDRHDVRERDTLDARVDDRLRGQSDRQGRIIENEIIVQFKDETTPRRVRSDSESVEALLETYLKDTNIAYAEPNYIAEAFAVPNDPLYPYQWNFDNATYGGIHAAAAWDVTNGAGVIVAVIDTGVAYENYVESPTKTHYQAPDLATTAFVAGYDFVSDDTHANDDNGHGTHVAGTIAGATNNTTGVSGLAYGAKIMPIKVLDSNGSGSYFDVAAGIRFAADNGAKVINLSLGGPSGTTYLEDALRYAYEKGVTIVAASGNDGKGTVSYPAAYDAYVIAVGATRFDEKRSSYSNYGVSLDIVAPGGDTSVDQNSDGYGDGILQQTLGSAAGSFGYYYYQGTSMATPHVAAAAALVIKNGASSPTAVRAALQTSADDLGAAGRDNTFGYGLLNVAAALGAPATSTPTPEPEPAPEIQVFTESFENGLSAWSQDSQNDWFTSSQRAKAGTRAAEVDGSANDAQLKTGTISLGDKTNARISFHWFIESSLDKNEYLAFDVSTNGGASWSEYGRLRANVDVENSWRPVTVTLNNVSNILLRFRAKMSDSAEDANVDDVRVVAF